MNELQLILQGEHDRRIEVITLPSDAKAEVILIEAKRLGFAIEEVLIFIEGRDEPVELDVVLRNIGVGHRHIETVVHCQNKPTKQRAFRPHTTVGDVKAWYVGEIHMPAVDATEHVLQITNTQDRPEPDLTIGSLVHHDHCALDFTLVPRKRVEG